MKKKLYVVVLSVFLSSCASLADVTNLIFTPTPPPVTETPTALPTETPAPTQNLFATSTSTPLTFTPTVTQIGAESFTATATSTTLPTPTPIKLNILNNGYFTPIGEGFLSVLTSSGVLYWNEGPCNPRNVTITAYVEDIPGTRRVLLFTRLREKKNTLNLTDWNSGAIMTKDETGFFYYDLGTENLRRYFYFKDAWIEYQLVAQDKNLNVIGRTPIYDRQLSLVRCMPIR